MASYLLMTEAECLAARALDVPNSGIAFGGRVIDNPLANNTGNGVLVGGAGEFCVVPARLLNDPDYAGYYAHCSGFPIITVDAEVLFLPDPAP